MTREEYLAQFRHRWLGLFSEAWGSRHLKPSDYGLMMDRHLREMDLLISEMHESLTKSVKLTPVNGKPEEVKGWTPK